MNISPFRLWILKRIVSDAVRQGPHHANNISKIYAVIRDCCRSEFYEDNDVTLDSFLDELFAESCRHRVAKCDATADPERGRIVNKYETDPAKLAAQLETMVLPGMPRGPSIRLLVRLLRLLFAAVQRIDERVKRLEAGGMRE